MSRKRSSKISTLGSQVTSVFSVALVLLLSGLIATLLIAAGRITSNVLGSVTIIAKLDLQAGESEAAQVSQWIADEPYTATLAYSSAQDVLEAEMEQNQDMLDLLDENPYSAEFEITLHPTYVNADSIRYIVNRLMLVPYIDEVVSQTDVVEAVNSAIKKLTAVLGAAALALFIISLVLIYNTVSIGVYARRFVIRTMQLVGATSGFIIKPFVIAGLFSGILAAIIASALLVGSQLYVSTLDINLYLTLPWGDVALVCCGMLVLGVAICTFASLCATNKYLGKDLDALYV